jgi:hypothetical protein
MHSSARLFRVYSVAVALWPTMPFRWRLVRGLVETIIHPPLSLRPSSIPPSLAANQNAALCAWWSMPLGEGLFFCFSRDMMSFDDFQRRLTCRGLVESLSQPRVRRKGCHVAKVRLAAAETCPDCCRNERHHGLKQCLFCFGNLALLSERCSLCLCLLPLAPSLSLIYLL